MPNIFVENYDLPPVNIREALRYAGGRGEDEGELLSLLAACGRECAPLLTPRVVYTRLSTAELFSCVPQAMESAGLLKAIEGADGVLLFAASVGLGVDRLIARYSRVSPVKALLFQALGAERIEALCDAFCEKKAAELGAPLGRRFSAGYGDFSLTAQREIFQILDCPKRIGLTLTEGLMTSPTKSVTAIVGVDVKEKCAQACAECTKEDCGYRV